ncbi:Threonylcarbamoyl-AMP synthase [subsurface metagenome]
MGLLLKLSRDNKLDKIFLEKAADAVIEGKIIAYPTNTVYGLGGDPQNLKVINRIFEMKFRERDKGLPILVSDIEEARKIGEFNLYASQIAEYFWPGQVTIIVKKILKSIPQKLTGGKQTVAIRVPENGIILAILGNLKSKGVLGGIIGTSANISDQENIIEGEYIPKLLFDQIDVILDCGKTLTQIPSTIVDCSSAKKKSELKFLRIGSISKEEILKIFNDGGI